MTFSETFVDAAAAGDARVFRKVALRVLRAQSSRKASKNRPRRRPPKTRLASHVSSKACRDAVALAIHRGELTWAQNALRMCPCATSTAVTEAIRQNNMEAVSAIAASSPGLDVADFESLCRSRDVSGPIVQHVADSFFKLDDRAPIVSGIDAAVRAGRLDVVRLLGPRLLGASADALLSLVAACLAKDSFDALQLISGSSQGVLAPYAVVHKTATMGTWNMLRRVLSRSPDFKMALDEAIYMSSLAGRDDTLGRLLQLPQARSFRSKHFRAAIAIAPKACYDQRYTRCFKKLILREACNHMRLFCWALQNKKWCVLELVLRHVPRENIIEQHADAEAIGKEAPFEVMNLAVERYVLSQRTKDAMLIGAAKRGDDSAARVASVIAAGANPSANQHEALVAALISAKGSVHQVKKGFTPAIALLWNHSGQDIPAFRLEEVLARRVHPVVVLALIQQRRDLNLSVSQNAFFFRFVRQEWRHSWWIHGNDVHRAVENLVSYPGFSPVLRGIGGENPLVELLSHYQYSLRYRESFHRVLETFRAASRELCVEALKDPRVPAQYVRHLLDHVDSLEIEDWQTIAQVQLTRHGDEEALYVLRDSRLARSGTSLRADAVLEYMKLLSTSWLRRTKFTRKSRLGLVREFYLLPVVQRSVQTLALSRLPRSVRQLSRAAGNVRGRVICSVFQIARTLCDAPQAVSQDLAVRIAVCQLPMESYLHLSCADFREACTLLTKMAAAANIFA